MWTWRCGRHGRTHFASGPQGEDSAMRLHAQALRSWVRRPGDTAKGGAHPRRRRRRGIRCYAAAPPVRCRRRQPLSSAEAEILRRGAGRAPSGTRPNPEGGRGYPSRAPRRRGRPPRGPRPTPIAPPAPHASARRTRKRSGTKLMAEGYGVATIRGSSHIAQSAAAVFPASVISSMVTVCPAWELRSTTRR